MFLGNPYDPGCDPCDMAFTMFADRTDRIEQAISRLASEPDPNDYATQMRVFNECNIKDLTYTEVQYIENEVAKKWQY